MMIQHVLYQGDRFTVSMVLDIQDSQVEDVISCEVSPVIQAPYRGKNRKRGLVLSEGDEQLEAQLPYLLREAVSVETAGEEV